MKKKRFLIFGINYHPELTGIGKYTSEMVNWLVSQDYNCTVVTSYPYYPYWKLQKPYKNLFFKKEVFNDGKLSIYRCPIYIPQRPSGLKRIIHDASFFLTSALVFISLIFKKKYDYVITISPPFHIGLISLCYRFTKGGRMIYHIQDLQIDAAKELNMVKSDTLFKIMFYVENFIIKKADVVSSISDGMIKKIKKKVDRQVIKLPNWADTANFWPLANKKDLKAYWGFNQQDYIILYSGNLGEKQGLGIIIDLAVEAINNTRVKFVICGAGAYKDILLAKSKEKKLNNVTFLPLQEYEVFNRFLNMADMHLILQKSDAGDLVMPSKLATILSVGGLVLVTAMPGTSLYEIVENNNIGLLAVPENVQSISNAIIENINKNNDDICRRARVYAEANLSINSLMPHFLNDLL
jgi:colanic acid biosynthesis glycosyl transferase WcaI